MLVLSAAGPDPADMVQVMGLDGFVSDIFSQIGSGVNSLITQVGSGLKAGAASLKDLSTIRSKHDINVQVTLPDASQIVKSTLPAMLIAVIALTGAIYVVKRIVSPTVCPIPAR